MRSTLGLCCLFAFAFGGAAAAAGAEERAREDQAPTAAEARPPPATEAPPAVAAQPSAANPADAARAADAQTPPAESAETPKRVVFVPETVKAQIREELKQEVLEQARREGWATPNAVPEWLRRFKPSGDLRVRLDRTIFGRGNANGGEFPDFSAINSGKPFDVNFVDAANERYLNVDQNRTRPRLRARLGLDVTILDWVSAGARVASGDSSTPISTNQTLGGSGGEFSKYQLWVDRAFVVLQPLNETLRALSLELGRFANPFFATELLWSDNVNLDGAAFQGRLGSGAFESFLVAGAFPVFTTGFNFPGERTDKFPSRNKWLYAAQLGGAWKASESVDLKVAAAFYDFDKLEGRVSDSCDTNLSFVTCNTDDSRPSFSQNGNTYLALRTPSAQAQALEAASTVPRYQYFGLASRFRELAATARLGLRVSPQLKLGATGEFVHNAGLRKSEVARVALNNRGPIQEGGDLGPFAGGNNGFLGRLTLGSPSLLRRGDWLFGVSYRYLQSDAVPDAFNDPDFGLGGTNLKGYTLEGTLVLGEGLNALVRWLSSDQIAGPKYSVDVLQVDLQARF